MYYLIIHQTNNIELRHNPRKFVIHLFLDTEK